jgi:large subunit ribosomal protein L5
MAKTVTKTSTKAVPKAAQKAAPKAALKAEGGARTLPRMRVKFEESVVPDFMNRNKLTNRLQVPRLEKIVVNVGMGEAVQNVKLLDSAASELALLAGQRPVVTRAKKSIAGFKIRQGMPIGCKVTLRGDRMYEFFDRLVSAVLPRLRDFRGVSLKAFDGRGNYTLGLKEQLIFPEIKYDDVQHVHGMDVTIVTTAGNDESARELLRQLGMPFRGTK